MDGLLTGAEPGLVGNWRLDEASGTIATDQSSSGNDGTLGGAIGPAAEPTWDGYSTDMNVVLNVPAGTGVLANDLDAEGDTLTATNLDTSSTLGLVTLNADGSFTYDPNGQFNFLLPGQIATDTFSYTANDGTGDSNVATVTITIVGVDVTAPIVTVNALTTNDSTPQLTGTVDDPLATIQVTVGGNSYAATNNGDGTWALADDTIAPALADGTYDVAVTATDPSLNAGTDGSVNELVIDTAAPTVTVNNLTTNDTTPQLTGTISDPTATIQVTVNGNTYAATNNGDGTWTLADDSIAPALADGTYDVAVTATDAATNAGTDGSVNELVIDTAAPTVTVNSLTTNDTTPQLTGTVSDPAATIQVTVNGNTYAATNNGDGTWTLADNTIAPALVDGTYDVAVTATDAATNAGTDASINELVIDTAAPTVTVNNLTTNDTTPQLTGTVSDPAATIQVTVNGNTYAATNNGDGTWTLADDTIAPALADGTYDVAVTATDPSLNAGTDGSVNELVIDTAAPTVTVNSLTTNDATPQLTGTVNDPAATIQVTVNGNTYAATNNGDGTWTLADDTIAPALTDGTYDVAVTATDAATNAGTDASINELVIDTTAPTVTVNPLTTNDSTPQLNGTVSDPAATIQVTVGGNSYAATNNGDGTWTLADNTIAPALADGTYDVAVTATDAATNAGTDASINELVIDTNAPAVTVNTLITNDSTPQLTGTVSDPAATIQVTVGGNTYAATNNGDGTWTLADDTIAPALADGTYDVAVTATDATSNVGTDASINELTVDTTAPVVTVNPLTTNDPTPQLTGTVDDPLATIQVTVGGNSYAATNNGDGTWTLADNTIAPALADGTYDVSATATDAATNAGTDITVNELTIDTNITPVANDDAYTVAENGTLATVAGINDVLQNDTDANFDPLIVNTTPVSGPSDGTLVLNADGTFTYTPDLNFSGSDSFVYEISDGRGGLAQATVTITVTPVNNAPSANADGYTIAEDGSLVIGAAAGVLDNDTDTDGDSLTANTTAVVGPTNGMLVLAADGSFTYSPDANFFGSDSFVYEVNDGNGGTAQANVNINVTSVNDMPAAIQDNLLVSDDLPLSFTAASMLANDTDIEGEALTIVSVSTPSFGTLSDDGNGNYIYTPGAGFQGTDSFSYTVADASGGTATAFVFVDVAGAPLPPTDNPTTPPGDESSDPDPDSPAPDDEPAADPEAPTQLSANPVVGGPVPTTINLGMANVHLVGSGTPIQAEGSDTRNDAPAPAKFLYDRLSTLATGFEFEGFGLKDVNLNHDVLFQALDTMKREMSGLAANSDERFAAVVTQVAVGTSVALSAGFVSWVIRGGALATTLLSTMPVWKGFDPLPLLAARRKKSEDDDENENGDNQDNWSDAIAAERMFFNQEQESEQTIEAATEEEPEEGGDEDHRS
ncbi:MAG: beta strand repeat-containing protein [Gammaproteobacteria bacterium]